MSVSEENRATGESGDGINVGRMVKVLVTLAAAMGLATGLCFALWSEPTVADRGDPASMAFPENMARLAPWRYVILHQSIDPGGAEDPVHPDDSAGGANAEHFHFLIGRGNAMKDGAVRCTAFWLEQKPIAWPDAGASAEPAPGDPGTGSEDRHGIRIALGGDFDRRGPTEGQMDSLVELVYHLTRRCHIPLTRVYCHRELEPVSCPGAMFPATQFFRRLGERCRGGKK